MCKILIFGGTTEGRLLSEFCAENKIPVFVSVATEYGAELLEKSEFLHILTGRMTCPKMTGFILENGINLVFDATHPYAVEVTENIISACMESNVRYLRVLRSVDRVSGYGRYFPDVHSLVGYLSQTSGGILITTGSKELHNFCRIDDFRERCVARVLPSEKIISECIALGFDKRRIIAEQGPFSEQSNISHLKKYKAVYLVTKESGSAGGFEDKVLAAEKCGAELLIISRPSEIGISMNEAEKILIAEKING